MTFREKLEKDVILLDGAFGTYVQSLALEESDFGDKKGCLEYLSLTRPDIIRQIHGEYLKAGADAVETNTFGANRVKLSEYGLAEKVYHINLSSAKLAREKADEFSTNGFPRYVVGTMGPTGKLPSSLDITLGDIGYRQLKEVFREQAAGLIDGGSEAILVETGQDLLEMKAAVNGIRRAAGDSGKSPVIMAHFTLANNGRMLLGTEASAAMTVLYHLGVDVIGLNCGAGPLEMEGVVEYLSRHCPVPVSCVPNAGLPIERDGKTVYPLGDEEMARIMVSFVEKYNLNVIGGCCGTGPGHISRMREYLGKPPAGMNTKKPGRGHGKLYCASFYKGFDLDGLERPIKVGERINTQGSRKMKEMLLRKDFDGIIELGKTQQNKGAQFLDVCSVLTERSTEKRDTVLLTKRLAESVEIPLMIDSTDTDVIEEALCEYPGTAVINSVNLEDGGRKAGKVFDLAIEHGSFVVGLAIDEKGMARSPEHKISVAKKLYKIGVKEHGLPPNRLIFDMLTFSLCSGQEEYRDSAVNTIEAVKNVKKTLPGVLTILGVSNVSFGLTRNARKALNMVFLDLAVAAGLDLAIVNPDHYLRVFEIDSDAAAIAEDIILNRDPGALGKLVEYFAGKSHGEKAVAEKKKAIPIEERLKACVLNRNKAVVTGLLDEALSSGMEPDRIINDILLEAMREVGDKLDSGEFVLPYVLQSAEVMKTSVEYLEKFMRKDNMPAKGKILLATVFGDVHDIGKNLAKMILANNGFTVIDLGKQVPVEKIVEEAKKNKVDAIGLSALLVSTARYMKICVQSLHEAGLYYPVIIGGAPVNEKFARETAVLKDKSIYGGGVFYAKDAFTGLGIMRILMDKHARGKAMADFMTGFGDKNRVTCVTPEKHETPPSARPAGRSRGNTGKVVPVPPFYGVRVINNISVDEIFGALNKKMLFDAGWGRKKKDNKAPGDLTDLEYKKLLEELKDEGIRKGWFDFKAVYGYFSCLAEDSRLKVVDEKGREIETFIFDRSTGRKTVCLADYFSDDEDIQDLVAFQAVTVGDNINGVIEDLGKRNEYSRMYFVHGLSVYLAETLAEYMHMRINRELGLKKGRGKRYSPGYPLWKNMKDQGKIFRILDVERYIGVKLTDSFQMVPEQSTTAMIVYNDDAEY